MQSLAICLHQVQPAHAGARNGRAAQISRACHLRGGRVPFARRARGICAAGVCHLRGGRVPFAQRARAICAAGAGHLRGARVPFARRARAICAARACHLRGARTRPSGRFRDTRIPPGAVFAPHSEYPPNSRRNTPWGRAAALDSEGTCMPRRRSRAAKRTILPAAHEDSCLRSHVGLNPGKYVWGNENIAARR